MKRSLIGLIVIGLWGLSSYPAVSQSPNALYTWSGTGDVRQWQKNFGTNSVALDNGVAGELRVTETGSPGTGVAIADDFNRVRESSASSGGTDLTGLDFLEFDLGHNGTGPINVQFFVQAGPAPNFVALGPDLTVTPGVNTYQVPLSGLTPAQLVYVRTMGFNVRDHVAIGNVVWTVREVRSGGVALDSRALVTHDNGTLEGGLQGAIANFDTSAVAGNTGQDQSGLSHNSSGSGSLQWTDLGGSQGAAISWGNGTAWNGNTFNNRTTDLSNYETMIVRMSAAEVTPGAGGPLRLQAFFQVNNFNFESAESGATKSVPLDGQFHDVIFSIAGLANMDVVDQTGINLGAHPTNLLINVDSVTFVVPEPAISGLLSIALFTCAGMGRRSARRG